MRVVVTGAAAHLGRVLLPALAARKEIETITGIDLKPSGFVHEKYRESLVDVRDPSLADSLAGSHVVIHMAFVVLRGALKGRRHDRQWVRAINVGGSHNVFEQARLAGVGKIIHLSSSAVYGAFPDNPPLMTEDQPLRPMAGFSYAEDKVAVERGLDEFEARRDAPTVVRLRPHVILGPQAQPFLRRLLAQPCFPRLPDPQPLAQCVWETDVAAAIVAATLRDVQGAFNLAADPPLPFKDMIALLHRRPVGVPFTPLCRIHRWLWQLTGAAQEPGWLEAMAHSLAVDSGRARHALNWEPRYSTRQCVINLFGERHGRGRTLQAP